MTEIDNIKDQLRRSLDGDSWQGPSVREILDGVSAETAASHPVGGVHSIWELLLHMTAWVRAVHSRLHGQVTEISGDSDWPPVRDNSEHAWKDAIADLWRAQSELVSTLDTFTDADLSGPVPNRPYDRAHLLHGLAQHHSYHSGQMSLLKKAAQSHREGVAGR